MSVGRGVTRREFVAGATASVAAAGLAGCMPFSKGGQGAIGSLPSYGIPSPTGYLRSNWSRDPFSLCSYSALAPSPLGTGGRALLAEPVADRLAFAGEATSSGSPAYVHGALLSGRRAAAELAGSAPSGSSVIVIGAGAAGLACARELVDAGFDVEVLEARDRVGGRVWTEELNGAPAEMGASWISGVGNNVLTPFAREAGVKLMHFDYDLGFVVPGQARQGRAGDRQMWSRLNSYDWRMGAPAVTPVSDLMPRRRSPGLQWALAYNIAQEFGVDAEGLSVLGTGEGAWEKGGDALIRGSYQDLVTGITGELPVRLEAVVEAVAYGPSGVEIGLRGGGSVESDFAVVTLPIGVLKAGSVDFNPPLPARKQAAINALGAGLLDKLWLSFDEVFWDGEAEMIHWIDPARPGRWAEWVNGYKLTGKPLLLGFNGGGIAREMSGLGDEEVVDSGMRALDSMFG